MRSSRFKSWQRQFFLAFSFCPSSSLRAASEVDVGRASHEQMSGLIVGEDVFHGEESDKELTSLLTTALFTAYRRSPVIISYLGRSPCERPHHSFGSKRRVYAQPFEDGLQWLLRCLVASVRIRLC